MKPLFDLFWQICRFRRGPEDVPYSQSLLLLVLVLGLALGGFSIPLLAALEVPSQESADVARPGTLQQVLAQCIITGGWMLALYILLAFKNQQSRYLQTMTAALGTDLVLGIPQILLYAIMVANPVESWLVGVAQLVLLFFYIWDMLVKGHIYSRSLSLSRLQGNLLSVALNFGLYAFSSVLLSPSTPQ